MAVKNIGGNWIGFVIGILVLAGTICISLLGKQLLYTQEKSEELLHDRRPLVFTKITGVVSPIQLEQDHLTLTISYRLENWGTMAATNVFFYATMIFQNATTSASAEYKKGQVCARFSDRISESNGAGTPGIQLLPSSAYTGTFRIDDVLLKTFTASQTNMFDGDLTISVPVCVI